MYYRLDSIGFLSVPELETQSLGDLNAGFYDQIEALRFVKEHIASFGGDPSKVTIDGQSAGGSSIELHLTANIGRDLFHQAIGQSVFRTPLPSPEQQRVCAFQERYRRKVVADDVNPAHVQLLCRASGLWLWFCGGEGRLPSQGRRERPCSRTGSC